MLEMISFFKQLGKQSQWPTTFFIFSTIQGKKRAKPFEANCSETVWGMRVDIISAMSSISAFLTDLKRIQNF